MQDAAREGRRHERIRSIAMERVDAWTLREFRLAGPGDRRAYSGSSERLRHGRCAVCSPACGSAGNERARTGAGNRLRPPQRQRTARCGLPPGGLLRHPPLRHDNRAGWVRCRGRTRRTGSTVPGRTATAPDIRRLWPAGLRSTRPRSRRSRASRHSAPRAPDRRGSRSNVAMGSSTSTVRRTTRASNRKGARRRGNGR